MIFVGGRLFTETKERPGSFDYVDSLNMQILYQLTLCRVKFGQALLNFTWMLISSFLLRRRSYFKSWWFGNFARTHFYFIAFFVIGISCVLIWSTKMYKEQGISFLIVRNFYKLLMIETIHKESNHKNNY